MHNTTSKTPANPYRFVRTSANKKTGPIPVTSTAAQSCPDACPMKTTNEGGCYAASGNSAIHWRNLTEGKAATALDLDGLTHAIIGLPKGQIWRMNESGDLMPRQDDPATIDAETLRRIVQANHNKRGFTYTHHALTPENRTSIRKANERGFTINVSTNNLAHADRAAYDAPGLPIVTLVPEDQWRSIGKNYSTETPEGRHVVRCPAETMPGVTCESCQLCAVASRKSIVGFTPHGTSKRRVIKIAQNKGNA